MMKALCAAAVASFLWRAGAAPAECETGCVTAFGTVLGSSRGGVEAFSNCAAACVSHEPAHLDGVNTGMQFQCVEYARRWLLQSHSIVFGDVATAADMWDGVKEFTRVYGAEAEGGQGVVKASRHAVGQATEPPRVGDLLIYSEALLGTGHVAVVVDAPADGAGVVRVAEQNFANEAWPRNCSWARELQLRRAANGSMTLPGEAHALGWIRPELGGDSGGGGGGGGGLMETVFAVAGAALLVIAVLMVAVVCAELRKRRELRKKLGYGALPPPPPSSSSGVAMASGAVLLDEGSDDDEDDPDFGYARGTW